MPQIFRPYADSVARATLVTLLLGPFAIAGLASWTMRSNYITTSLIRQSRSTGCRSVTPITSAVWPRLPLLPRRGRKVDGRRHSSDHTCMTCPSQLVLAVFLMNLGRASALLRLTRAAAPALSRIPVVLTFAGYLRGALTETVPLRGRNAGLRGDRNAAPTRFLQPRRRDFIDL
jgi:hypothetical protein